MSRSGSRILDPV